MSTASISQPHQNSNALAKVAGVPSHERDPQYAEDAVREWAERQAATFRATAETIRYAIEQCANPPNAWQQAVLAAAERMANAEVRAHVPSTGTPVVVEPVTHHYRFAPSSHRSKRVRYCKDCAKLGRKCWRHDGHKVAAR